MRSTKRECERQDAVKEIQNPLGQTQESTKTTLSGFTQSL